MTPNVPASASLKCDRNSRAEVAGTRRSRHRCHRLIAFKVVGTGGVNVDRNGTTTVYSGSLAGAFFMSIMILLVCLTAVILWLSPSRYFAFASLCLGGLALYGTLRFPLREQLTVTT